jgi:hypothetical protein
MKLTINLPENIQNIFAAEAMAHSRSLEEEIFAKLVSFSDEKKRRGEEAWERIRLRREMMLAERGGIPFPDSTDIIRESRENDH